MRDLRTLYGDSQAAEFGPLALRALRERWIDGDLSRKSCNDYTAIVKAVFRFGVSHELVPPSVHVALTAVEALKAGRTRAKGDRKVAPVPLEHVEAVLPHLSSPIKALVKLQLLTGARSGEILPLRPRDIDRTDPEVWTATLEHHKTAYKGKARILYFGPESQEVLRPFLLRDADHPLFSPKDAVRERHEKTRKGPGRRANQKPNAPKTSRVVRDTFDRQSYNHAIRRACAKAGVTRWHPHQLRHNRATDLRHALGIESARVALGHSSAGVTEIYAEADQVKARTIALERG